MYECFNRSRRIASLIRIAALRSITPSTPGNAIDGRSGRVTLAAVTVGGKCGGGWLLRLIINVVLNFVDARGKRIILNLDHFGLSSRGSLPKGTVWRHSRGRAAARRARRVFDTRTPDCRMVVI